MSKFNYISWNEVPPNVEEFFYTVWNEEDASISEVNEFLNNLDVWYESQNMKIEDFYIG